jgi:hypothetical protein
MKNKLAILIAFTLLTTAAFAGSATQKADVPFAFHLGNKVMPAGSYTIRQLTSQSVVIKQEGSGAVSTIALTFSAQRDAKDNGAKLVFDRVGDQYFLVQIWGANTESGKLIASSRSQEKLERNSQSNIEIGSK